MSQTVGRVLGTLDAMPLEFWVGVEEGQYLQLDDVVEVLTPLPDGTEVRLFGVVDLVRARHEGAKFDSDVFLIETGVLPATVAHAARQGARYAMAHGSADPMIAFARATASRDLLQQQGHAPEWHEYRMPHSVCPQEIADIGAWLRRVLA